VVEVTARDLLDRLAVRYAAPAYFYLEEVRNGTGFAVRPRTADAIALGLWPSRGMMLEGFEVKASRSDWLIELRNPAKAEEGLYPYCDRWWLVAEEKVLQSGELPPTWGLLAPARNGLTVKVDAPRREPVEIDHLTLAGIFRGVQKSWTPGVNLDAIRKEERESAREDVKFDLEEKDRRFADIQKSVYDFESASGVNIRKTWSQDPKNIGAAVRMVLDGKHNDAKRDLLAIRERLAGILQYMDRELEHI
jgi:hypothetical protein